VENQGKRENQGKIENRNAIVATAFEQSDQPMMVVDPGGRIVLASDGAGVLLGVARADLIGQDLKQFFLRPETLAECREAWHSGVCPLPSMT
jgi:PAS domain S-box-containing protein